MNSVHRQLLAGLYSALVRVGRPFGGIRPFRIMNWLRKTAWREPPVSSHFKWITDAWGCSMKLHPYYLIDHHIIAQGTYDKPLHRCIQRSVRPGMTVFDVGANIGSVALHLSRCAGSSGMVVCFEPV